MTHAFIRDKMYCTPHTHTATSVSITPSCNCVVEKENEQKEHLHGEIIIHHVLTNIKHLKMKARDINWAPSHKSLMGK
jgi:hypothetical protein